MDFAGNGFFPAGTDKDAELDGPAVGLDKVIGLFKNVPIYPAVQMFNNPEFDGLVFLVIADSEPPQQEPEFDKSSYESFVGRYKVRANKVFNPLVVLMRNARRFAHKAKTGLKQE